MVEKDKITAEWDEIENDYFADTIVEEINDEEYSWSKNSKNRSQSNHDKAEADYTAEIASDIIYNFIGKGMLNLEIDKDCIDDFSQKGVVLVYKYFPDDKLMELMGRFKEEFSFCVSGYMLYLAIKEAIKERNKREHENQAQDQQGKETKEQSIEG